MIHYKKEKMMWHKNGNTDSHTPISSATSLSIIGEQEQYLAYAEYQAKIEQFGYLQMLLAENESDMLLTEEPVLDNENNSSMNMLSNNNHANVECKIRKPKGEIDDNIFWKMSCILGFFMQIYLPNFKVNIQKILIEHEEMDHQSYLKNLVFFNDDPSLIQITFFKVTFSVLWDLLRVKGTRSRVKKYSTSHAAANQILTDITDVLKIYPQGEELENLDNQKKNELFFVLYFLFCSFIEITEQLTINMKRVFPLFFLNSLVLLTKNNDEILMNLSGLKNDLLAIYNYRQLFPFLKEWNDLYTQAVNYQISEELPFKRDIRIMYFLKKYATYCEAKIIAEDLFVTEPVNNDTAFRRSTFLSHHAVFFKCGPINREQKSLSEDFESDVQGVKNPAEKKEAVTNTFFYEKNGHRGKITEMSKSSSHVKQLTHHFLFQIGQRNNDLIDHSLDLNMDSSFIKNNGNPL